MTEEKVRENRLRRMAKRQGLQLLKSRARDPRAIGYGGYMLVDSSHVAVLGGMPYAFCASMDDVETSLTGE
jgi:hypothetical protein